MSTWACLQRRGPSGRSLSDCMKGVARLQSSGAVLIEGPKACGKTETARQQAATEIRLDVDGQQRAAAEVTPVLVLDRPAPLLIDEWQLVPSIWAHVRRAVDDRKARGQFILTGSAGTSRRGRPRCAHACSCAPRPGDTSSTRPWLAFAGKIDTSACGQPGVLAVVTGTGLAYRRKDGVHVVPIGTLGP